LNNLKDKKVGDAIKEVDPEGKYEFIVWINVIGNQIEQVSFLNFNAK
jgi:hypothetical protein